MHTKQLVEKMMTKDFYSHSVNDCVRLVQTNLSYVFLTGQYAYKIKKPVNFGFLNYQSLANRHFYCDEEIRLNQNSTQGIYIDVVPITFDGFDYCLKGDSEIVEYAVKMNQFPEGAILESLIDSKKMANDWIADLVGTILEFHKTTCSNRKIQAYGDRENIRLAFDENYEQTRKYVGGPQTLKQFNETKKFTDDFFRTHKKLLIRRQVNGYIRDGHGNLHLGNIAYWNDKFHLFDRIEFNESFRYIDVIADLAFLLMDFEARGYHQISQSILKEYLAQWYDPDHIRVLPLYLSRQAYVQAKVLSFKLDQPDLEPHIREELNSKASQYYRWAWRYIQT